MARAFPLPEIKDELGAEGEKYSRRNAHYHGLDGESVEIVPPLLGPFRVQLTVVAPGAATIISTGAFFSPKLLFIRGWVIPILGPQGAYWRQA